MLRLVRKERLQNIVAVLYLAIVGHTIRISHPEAFAPDDAYRRLRGRIVNQPRVIWSGSFSKSARLFLAAYGIKIFASRTA